VNIDLSDRSAVVTGAAQGLGYATAKCLAVAGASVWVADIQGDKAQQAAATLRDEGLTVRAVTLDITDRDSVRAAFELAAGETGKLDILVNNASVIIRQFFADIDLVPIDQIESPHGLVADGSRQPLRGTTAAALGRSPAGCVVRDPLRHGESLPSRSSTRRSRSPSMTHAQQSGSFDRAARFSSIARQSCRRGSRPGVDGRRGGERSTKSIKLPVVLP